MEKVTHEVIILNEEDRNLALPGIREMAGEVIFGSKDSDGNIVSVAVFAPSEIKPGEVVLRYLYTVESERYKGYGTDILQYAVNRLGQNQKLNSIYAEVIGDVESTMKVYGMMMRAGFLPTKLTGRLALYDLADIFDQSVLQKRVPRIYSSAGIISIKGINNPLAASVLNIYKNMGSALDKDFLKRGKFMALTNVNDILAIMSMEQTDENMMLFSDICMVSGSEENYEKQLMYLIVGALATIEYEHTQIETVGIKYFNSLIGSVVQKILGEGEKKIVHEYLYLLNGNGGRR